MKATRSPLKSSYSSSFSSPTAYSRSPIMSPMGSPIKSKKPQIYVPANIEVVARFRPESASEQQSNGINAVNIVQNSVSFKEGLTDYMGIFTFDKIFDQKSQQEEIFEYSIRESIDDVFSGFNGTIMTYGQTGSGKSFTMMGDLNDESRRGLVPRITEAVFAKIEKLSEEVEVDVHVSYLEIYLETFKDLLNPSNNSTLVLRENEVRGLEQIKATNSGMIYDLLKNSQQNRVISSTEMNEESSRSHTIFQIKITQKNKVNMTLIKGNLYLVDLAGSEKVSKTKATGKVLEEAKKINSSLSALGNVINALTDSSAKYVPYRDSKLTRILQDSLGGNSKTTMIINCSPSSCNLPETISSLRFGTRAKEIKNSVTVNSIINDLSQDIINEQYKAQIKKLKDQLMEKDNEINEMKSLQSKNEALENELNLLRSGGNMSDNNDVMNLQRQLLEATAIQKNLESELKSRSITIANYEKQSDDHEVDAVKLDALEKALLQFSIHLEEVEIQNHQLQKNILNLEQISHSRQEKIELLSRQLENQSKVVHDDTQAFEHKLNYLRTKVSSVKSSVPQQMHNKVSTQSLRTVTSNTEYENDKENIETTIMNEPRHHQVKYRQGLNFNVVKSGN